MGAESHRARESAIGAEALQLRPSLARVALSESASAWNFVDRLCFLDMFTPGPAVTAPADQTTRTYKDGQTGS